VNRLASILLAFVAVFTVMTTARASDPVLSPELKAIEVTDMRGQRLDPNLTFVDHDGKKVRIGDYLDGERPLIFTLNYYRCRVVCSVQLGGLADGLAPLDWVPGGDNFQVVTVSIDPHETPEDAANKRRTILASLGKGEDVGWHYLTGDEVHIRALAAQLGISYAYDAEQGQYAHPGVVVFVTPDGRVSQYVYGLTYLPRDLKFGLIEAGEGKIGNPVEQIYLSCFSYDPSIGRYGPFAFGIMRLGGVLTMLVLGGVLLFWWRRERQRSAREADQQSRGRQAEYPAEAT
jgi:protein SCO1/2